MTVSRIVLLLALSSGCASVGHDVRSARATGAGQPGTTLIASEPFTAGETSEANDASTARDSRAPAGAALGGARAAAAPLRHFYLLSPGPNATLVITRSDLPTH